MKNKSDRGCRILSKKEVDFLLKTLHQKFRFNIGTDETIHLGGEFGNGYSLVKFDLLKKDNTYHLWIETKVELDGLISTDCRDIALDFIDYTLSEYFRSDRGLHFYPDWKAYSFGDVEVWMRGEERKPNIDELANQLLNS